MNTPEEKTEYLRRVAGLDAAVCSPGEPRDRSRVYVNVTAGGVTALVSLPGDRVEMAGLETLPLFEDTFYLAVPLSMSERIAEPADLADLQHEKFVTMNEGFATAQRFDDAFREAGFRPVVVTRLNDIFSLMNMVQAGVGCSLVPHRIGKVFENSVRLIELAERYRKHQTIALVFPKNRERDPDILSLLAEARMLAHPPQD